MGRTLPAGLPPTKQAERASDVPLGEPHLEGAGDVAVGCPASASRVAPENALRLDEVEVGCDVGCPDGGYDGVVDVVFHCGVWEAVEEVAGVEAVRVAEAVEKG